jgi:DNA gyrase inhibitor GyrI
MKIMFTEEKLWKEYAIFEIEHTAEAVQKAWSEIFQKSNENGCQMDYTKPIIERFASKMVNNHKCEICVPIR